MVWSCHPLLQLNHSVRKTEAMKVVDLKMTTLKQNRKFHCGREFLCNVGRCRAGFYLVGNCRPARKCLGAEGRVYGLCVCVEVF